MSDEPTKQPITPPASAGIANHWCEHPGCTKWGSFGLLQPDKSIRWYCGEHQVGRADR